jgi:hypothetical protein
MITYSKIIIAWVLACYVIMTSLRLVFKFFRGNGDHPYD